MQPTCEIVVQKILPVIRADLTKTLIEQFGLTQREAAEKLRVTQPAVSQYLRELRGKSQPSATDAKLKKLINAFAKKLNEGKLSEREKVDYFCKICSYCRKSALICKFHPPKKGTECNLCLVELRCD